MKGLVIAQLMNIFGSATNFTDIGLVVSHTFFESTSFFVGSYFCIQKKYSKQNYLNFNYF